MHVHVIHMYVHVHAHVHVIHMYVHVHAHVHVRRAAAVPCVRGARAGLPP